MTDLSFVTVDEMWEEIKKRYDGALFVGCQNINTKQDSTTFFFEGGITHCMGLAWWSLCRFQQLIKPQEEEP